MIPAIASLALLSLGLIVALVKQSATHSATMQVLADVHAQDRADHARQVADLCQRIQAPQMAVIQHAQDTGTPADVQYPLDEAEQAQAQDWQLAASVALEQIHAHEAEAGAL